MVLDLLWPDADPAAAINSLNQTVFQLRRLLDPAYRDGRSPLYLISNSEAVQFNSDLVRTDLSEFRRLAARLAPSPEGTPAAEGVLDLIRGEFLSDVRYEDWAWNLATVVHNEVRAVLMPIATGFVRADHPELGVRAACALVSLDPLDETAQIAVAERLWATGRRAAGRESLIQFARRAREELDEEPSDALAAAMKRAGVEPSVHKELTTADRNPARA
jgi:DNA-binding SARP family transcriptional activator